MTNREEQIRRIRKITISKANRISIEELLKVIPDQRSEAIYIDDLAKEIDMDPVMLELMVDGHIKRTRDGRVWKCEKRISRRERAVR